MDDKRKILEKMKEDYNKLEKEKDEKLEIYNEAQERCSEIQRELSDARENAFVEERNEVFSKMEGKHIKIMIVFIKTEKSNTNTINCSDNSGNIIQGGKEYE